MPEITPHWMVAAPWSVTRPTNRPLAKGDLMAHKEHLPGHGPQNRTLLWPIAGRSRAVLPYLIPQSQAVTSRLVFAWAFTAPLVEIADVSIAVPLVVIHRIVPTYDSLTDAVIRQQAVANLELHSYFAAATESCVYEGQLCLIMHTLCDHVAVTPLDTPVHAFSAALADFPGN